MSLEEGQANMSSERSQGTDPVDLEVFAMRFRAIGAEKHMMRVVLTGYPLSG